MRVSMVDKVFELFRVVGVGTKQRVLAILFHGRVRLSFDGLYSRR